MTKSASRPVPWLSANNVEHICRKAAEGFDYFVEYGMGASTLFFIDRFRSLTGTLISLENTPSWFEETIVQAKARFPLLSVTHSRSPLSIRSIYALADQMAHAESPVPDSMSRLKKWKDSLELGPFYRFSPLSRTRFSGKVPFWRASRQILKLAARLAYGISPTLRPAYGECKAKVENLHIILRNVPPSIKDQFGEAPSKVEYIHRGLKDILSDLRALKPVKAVFVVDGGPRGDIVESILELESSYPHFYPVVFLCDAHQAIYRSALQRRPSGIFLAGSNRTLSGEVVQDTPRLADEAAMIYMFGKATISKEELAEKEVWYYEPALSKQPAAL